MGRMQSSYRYRLTFSQVLLNRLNVLAFCILSGAASLVCAFYAIKSPQENSAGLWLTGVAVLSFLLSCAVLLFGYQRWTRSETLLQFTDLGIEGLGPYRFLKVQNGLMRTSIIRSVTGHFIIVPKSIIPQSDLREFIERKKRETQNSHPRP